MKNLPPINQDCKHAWKTIHKKHLSRYAIHTRLCRKCGSTFKVKNCLGYDFGP